MEMLKFASLAILATSVFGISLYYLISWLSGNLDEKTKESIESYVDNLEPWE